MILPMLTFKVTGFNVETLKERKALDALFVPNAKRTGDPLMLISDMAKAVSGARRGLFPVVFG